MEMEKSGNLYCRSSNILKLYPDSVSYFIFLCVTCLVLRTVLISAWQLVCFVEISSKCELCRCHYIGTISTARSCCSGDFFLKKILYEFVNTIKCIKGELRAKFQPNFFFIYRFVYAYYNVMQNIIIFGKGFRKL